MMESFLEQVTTTASTVWASLPEAVTSASPATVGGFAIFSVCVGVWLVKKSPASVVVAVNSLIFAVLPMLPRHGF